MQRIYVIILLVIFGGIVLHAPLSVALSVLFPDYELLIKSWKEILMVALIPLAVTIISKRKLWHYLLGDWIFRLIVAYAVLHIVCTIFLFEGMMAAMAGLTIDLRYLLFFGLVYVALIILPEYRRLFIKVGVIGAFVVVGFATIQLFLPPDFLKVIGYSRDTIMPYLTVDKNPDYIRVNSTLRGPNPLGAYAGMVLALLTAALAKGKLRLQNKKVLVGTVILGLCSGVALWISYSRSALVAGIVGVLVVLALTIGRKLSRRSWIAACVILFALVGMLAAARGSEFVSNVILHENPEGGSSISSNDDHVTSLQTGLDRLIRQPLGGGVGSTGSASLHSDSPIIIENQYLFIAHEVGWLGFLLFLAIFGSIMIRVWRKRQDWLALGVIASGIGLGLIGLLLPVWTDDTVSIVWWGLAAIAVSGGKNGKTTK